MSNEPSDQQSPSDQKSQGSDPIINVVSTVEDAPIRSDHTVTTLQVTLPPGSAGTPPHRHAGPVFGYLVRGAMRFEVEGEPVRTIRPGEAFWEPGGDIIHYQDANALDDEETEFIVTLLLPPGAELLTLVDADELKARAHLRAPSASK